VKTIVRELRREDRHHQVLRDPREMIIEALKPAVRAKSRSTNKTHRILLKVATDDLAVAIGRKGQKRRLTRA